MVFSTTLTLIKGLTKLGTYVTYHSGNKQV